MNRSRPIDPALTALASLRDDAQLELPDPRVERRLARLAEKRYARRRASRPAAPAWARVAALAAAFTVLLGGSLWATVGIEGLRRWWYSIRVGDEHVAGAVEGSGRRTFDFTTPDGYAVHVRIERSPAPGPEHTRVEVQEAGPDELSQEVWEVGDADALEERRHPLALLGDERPLHRWTDDGGRECELYLIDEPERFGGAAESGDWVVVRDLGAPPERALLRVQALARSIGPEGRVDVVERPDGTLALELADGRGWVCALELCQTTSAPPQRNGLSTPSGRVRVELGDED